MKSQKKVKRVWPFPYPTMPIVTSVPLATKKRNPQDATIKRNIAPLRRDIKKLQADYKELKRQVKDLQEHLRAIDGLNGTPPQQS